MSPREVDLAVVGSGFGGSLIAMIARRLGRSVLLLERGRHPRFAIGESSTPLANLLLEELSQKYDLPRIRPLSKWGPWQRAYPEIACGLKRGFSFYHHSWDERRAPDPSHQRHLLVAASTRDEAADTHWYRPDFDHFLVREAERIGVEHIDQLNLQPPVFQGDSVRLEGERAGQTVTIRARFVIDATGPRGFLHRALGLPEATFDYLPATQTLFSHFRGVERIQSQGAVPAGQSPPYPVDDAALHHIFDGGWIWVLRFNNGLTSAGVAARSDLADRFRFAQGKIAWDALLSQLPSVRDQFAQATAELPFGHVPRLAFRCGQITGPRWALLPSAAGFIDPLLSTGFSLTLLGVLRLGEILGECWDTKRLAPRLAGYAGRTVGDLLAAERIVAALYASMSDFSLFTLLSLLYFAPVSYSEIAKRLGKGNRVTSFLLHDDPPFGPLARSCCEQVLQILARGNITTGQRQELTDRVLAAIAPIDLIGLSDLDRRNWYPLRLDDLLNGAAKLGMTKPQLESILEAERALAATQSLP